MRSQLGQKLAVHGGSLSAGGWLWYIGGLCALGTLAGVYHAITFLFSDTPNTEAVGTGVLCAIACPLVLIVPVTRWRQSVAIFEQGLVWTRLVGTTTISRSDVVSVELIHHRGRRQATQYDEVAIQLCDGRSISINGIEHAAQVFNFVRAWAEPRPTQSRAAAWAPPAPGVWAPPSPPSSAWATSTPPSTSTRWR